MSAIVAEYLKILRAGDAMAESVALAMHLGVFGAPCPRTSLLPYFCPRGYRLLFDELARRIYDGLESLSLRYFAGDPELRATVQMPRHLEALVHARHGYATHHPIVRADCFVDFEKGRVDLLELNAADPSAYAWNDWMQRGLWSLPSFETLAARLDLQPSWLVPKHAALVRRLHGGVPRKVALAIAPTSTVLFDFICLERLYREQGFETEVVAPENFPRDCDLVVRDTMDEIVGTPLADVVFNASKCVVNPIASTFGEQKSVLSWLGATTLAKPVRTPCALEARLPRTLLVNEANACAFGERARWVLKPAGGWGGHGVTIGAHAGENDWKRAMRAALAGAEPYVAQEYVTPPVAPMLGEDGKSVVDRYVNLSFWIFEGRFEAAFARLSDQHVINVHQGGALVPVVFHA